MPLNKTRIGKYIQPSHQRKTGVTFWHGWTAVLSIETALCSAVRTGGACGPILGQGLVLKDERDDVPGVAFWIAIVWLCPEQWQSLNSKYLGKRRGLP